MKKEIDEKQADRLLIEALEQLPEHRPPQDLAARVRRALDEPVPAKPARLLWAASSALAGGLAVLLVVLALPEKRVEPVVSAPKTPSICRLRSGAGQVMLKTDAGSIPIQAGRRLLPGDIVLTGGASRAEIDVDSDARLVLHRDSAVRVRLLSESVRSFDLNDGRVSVELLDGGKRAVRLLPAGYHVIADGRIGAFSASVAGEGRVAFAALRGSVTLTNNHPPERLESGHMLKLVSGRPFPGPEPLSEDVPLVVTEPHGPKAHPGRIEVAGRTDTHARVFINDRRVPVDADGRFGTELTVSQGEIIEVMAEDPAGNTKTVEIGPLAAPSGHPAEKPPKKVKAKSYRVTW